MALARQWQKTEPEGKNGNKKRIAEFGTKGNLWRACVFGMYGQCDGILPTGYFLLCNVLFEEKKKLV